jgi:hypothetical protein
MRSRVAAFWALFLVMMSSSRRGCPRLLAKATWQDQMNARESVTLVLFATVGAGRPLARKRAGCALPLPED